MAQPGRGGLFDLGLRLAAGAAERIVGDPRGQRLVGVASEIAQGAVRRLESLHAAAARAAGVPTRDEFHDLEERVARIQRRARSLGARVEALRDGARAEAGGVGRPATGSPSEQGAEPR